MDMQKITITNANKNALGVVCANVASGFLVIDGKKIKIEESQSSSSKFVACYVKGNGSRLY
jgi:hypothetical protein